MTLSAITYEVMIDWDATNWADDPVFSGDDDISDDVAYIEIVRGKETEEGNAPAATLQIRLKAGLCADYSPYNITSPYHDRIRPWLPVRIKATHNAVVYPVYFGFISSIKIDPRPDRQTVTLYVTDGTDLLARQMVTQDPEHRTKVSDGDAIERILDAAGWSTVRRNIDKDGGDDLFNYPNTYNY
ncbi:MAG: hypothetical protein MUO61_03485 [Dehalococcoidia bacterium]|nr:hypothetical protein [Dehalococcoidia bacterium]